MAETVLETDGLSMRFGGVVAVDHVSLKVRARELGCLIGPNGAGKSTCFKCLCGLLKPTEGRIFLRGEVYLDAAFEAIVREFGSLDRYLEVAAGLDAARRDLESHLRQSQKMSPIGGTAHR